ncbi:MAG: hypothetical protein ACR2RL_11340, partial [Gammaproteobacteria bacterium]
MPDTSDAPGTHRAERGRWPVGACLMVALPLAVVLVVIGPFAERTAVWAAAVLMIFAAAVHRRVARATHRDLPPSGVRLASIVTAAAGSMLASVIAIAAHLLGDDFAYRYVWLYSAVELPWYLKLSNVWGGDEGTLALMAALIMLGAARALRYRGWAFPGAALLGAAFAAGAGVWSPFEATPAADLARLDAQGINAHLATVWMAIHPPLIFVAFAL